MSFTKIDNDMLYWLQEQNVSSTTQIIYITLLSYCYGEKNICYPTQNELEEALHMCRRTVVRGIKELKEIGVIKVKKEHHGSGYCNNVYTVMRNPPVKRIRTKPFGYIYKITNTLNNRVYFGKREIRAYNITTEEEMLNDGYMGSGVELKADQIREGVENFKKEIVEVCYSKAELLAAEHEIIAFAKQCFGEICYNKAN